VIDRGVTFGRHGSAREAPFRCRQSNVPGKLAVISFEGTQDEEWALAFTSEISRITRTKLVFVRRAPPVGAKS
jgi:hypothetical protein